MNPPVSDSTYQEVMDGSKCPIGFKSTELTKDFLGVGSYGVVYKALCDKHLECAAKVIHSVLITEREEKPEHSQRLLPRFLKEIDYLSSVRHPNIVGYLGTSRDPNDLPMLLMELMDESLTQFLRRTQKPLPLHTQVSICRDIALALSFLHSNGIVHTNLWSNNVLMLDDRQAKVSDFGLASFFSSEQVHTALKVSEAIVYMPPEAKTSTSIACYKIDCFSFGVLCIQIMTKCFPKPEDQPQGIGSYLGYNKEISRRQNHICTIRKDHPLLPIALSCLKDNHKTRPTSSNLCAMLGDLETCRKISSTSADNDEPVIVNSPDWGCRTISSSSEGHAKLTDEEDGDGASSSIKDSDSKNLLSKFFMKLREDIDPAPGNSQVMSWSQQTMKFPEDVQHKTANAIYLDAVDTVEFLKHNTSHKYIYVLCGEDRSNLYSFNPTTFEWLRLQDPMLTLSSLVVVGTYVVTVGGMDLYASNMLYSRVGDEWKELLPPMLTRRYNTITVMSDSHLVVAGGVNDSFRRGRTIVSTVEVLDMNKRQWSTVASLPEPASFFTGQINTGRIWILGYSNAVFSCWLDGLIRSRSSSSTYLWRRHKMPVYASALISIDNNLYAIGGKVLGSNVTTDEVLQYNSRDDCWHVVSHMAAVRSHCLAVALPKLKTMVVMGGFSDSSKPINSVEIAMLQ